MVVGIRLVCLTYIQLLRINHDLHKVASTLLLIPITITRIASADGDKVPPWAAALTAAVFDTTGASLSPHVQSTGTKFDNFKAWLMHCCTSTLIRLIPTHCQFLLPGYRNTTNLLRRNLSQ